MCVCSNQYSRARLCCEDKQFWKMAQFRDPVSIGRRTSNEAEESRTQRNENRVPEAQSPEEATDEGTESGLREVDEVHQGWNQSRAEPHRQRAL